MAHEAVKMDHQQATQLMAVEKYLLDELAPEVRDEFEEHFFDCQECATDLRATAGFMDAAKREFRLNPVPKPGGWRPRANRAWPCCGLFLFGLRLPRPAGDRLSERGCLPASRPKLQS
jgi:anti-sigma factor RsiW